MIMQNPQDGLFYDVPQHLLQPTIPNAYRNPIAGVFGQNPIQQMPMPQPQIQQGAQFTVRSAANIEEVRATPIGLGTINVFHNQKSSEIYVSRYSKDGDKEIETFIKRQDAAGESPSPVLPVQSAIDLSGVYTRLDELKNIFIGGNKNESVESTNDNASPKGRTKPTSIVRTTGATVTGEGAE